MERFDKREQELWAQVSKGEGETKAQALMELGHAAFHEGKHTESLAMSETALQVYESLGAKASSAAVGFVYQSIGWSLKALKRYEEAADAAHKAVELYKAIGDKDLFRALNEEGDYWYDAQEWEKSFEVYSSALVEVNPDRSDESLAFTYGHCGFALGKMKRWEESLEHFLKSRELFKKLKNPGQVAFCDEEIALCYYKMGDGVSALDFAQRALDFADITEAPYRLIWANGRMGLAKKLLGEYDEALGYFIQSKTYLLAERRTEWGTLVRLEKLMAEVFEAQGATEEAEEVLRRIRVIEETLEGEDEDE
jgi:tetratricopeptide (TPR) repeat protein